MAQNITLIGTLAQRNCNQPELEAWRDFVADGAMLGMKDNANQYL